MQYTSGTTDRGASGPAWNDEEDRYWREAYSTRPYYSAALGYSVYQPAYRYGYDLYRQHGGRRYEEIDESSLESGWEQFKDKTELTWERAKDAVKDAYERLFKRKEASGTQQTGAR